MPLARPLLVALLGTALVPAAAHGQRTQDAFVNSVIPERIDHLIGFTPTYAGWLTPKFGPVTPERVRLGGRTYRFTYSTSAAAIGPSVDIYVRNALRQRRFPGTEGFFFDRALRANERPHMRVRLDLGRDADVLAVKRGHPACAGISRAAARSIAAGRLRTWTAAGVASPPGGDAIALRRAAGTNPEVAEPRFGASYKLPAGARGVRDGGLGEATGSFAVAAVTSWSRARSFQATTCAVPIGGAAPTDDTVRALSHPDAYPIRYVTLKRLATRRNPMTPAIVQGWVQFLGGPRAAKQFAQRGLLPAEGPWPEVRTASPAPPPQPQPEPEPPVTPAPEQQPEAPPAEE